MDVNRMAQVEYVEYQVGAAPDVGELTELYASVGWSGYTDHPEKMNAILAGSSWFMTARACGDRSLGESTADNCSVDAGSGGARSAVVSQELQENEESAKGASSQGEDPSQTCSTSGRAGAGELIGLVRVVSDNCSVALVQDLLVAPAIHRCGVGSHLLMAAMDRYAVIRQLMLITDDDPATAAFYRSCGLRSLDQTHGIGFIRYNFAS